MRPTQQRGARRRQSTCPKTCSFARSRLARSACSRPSKRGIGVHAALWRRAARALGRHRRVWVQSPPIQLRVVDGAHVCCVARDLVVARRPSTTSSESAGRFEHRLPRLSVVGSVLFVMTGLFGWGRVPVFVAVATVAGVPWLYSFILYRCLEGAR